MVEGVVDEAASAYRPTVLSDHVDYVSVRPDPDHVLPAGYAHPLLTIQERP